MTHQDTNLNAALPLRSSAQAALKVGGFLGLIALVALSAIVVKAAVGSGRSSLGPLAGISASDTSTVAPAEVAPSQPDTAAALSSVHDPLVTPEPTITPAPVTEPAPAPVVAPAPVDTTKYAASTSIRYFNGRPIRPARTIRMTVTAYSPDEKSCGPDARGITSSNHHVKTNAMKLVAADSKVLPLGSMITVPGYDSGNVVPVLDRGGAIKGNRLDVLFPTDAAARKWGVRKLDVVVWEYADNLPADDYRAIRDSKN